MGLLGPARWAWEAGGKILFGGGKVSSGYGIDGGWWEGVEGGRVEGGWGERARGVTKRERIFLVRQKNSQQQKAELD